jgi:hypothetical protein
MALRPEVVPQWVGKQYGQHGPSWDEAVRQCRAALLAWAASREAHTYSELVPLVLAIDWPDGPHTHEGQQMGYLLGQVSFDELDLVEDHPLLSALVISKEENMPSGGFWSFLAELGVSVGPSPDQRMVFWLKELNRCFDFYGSRPTHGVLTGPPGSRY